MTRILLPDDDDWSLDVDQMLFMIEHHNLIEHAFETGDMSSIDALVQTDQYRILFGDMSFDEAYDRYESTFED